MLSDRTIRKLIANRQLVIDPMPPDNAFQPASIDLRLGEEFRESSVISSTKLPGQYGLLPGECLLGHTVERITLPRDLVARVEGKSSWGRQFLMIHSTAGFIDPGFDGQITLELKNLGPAPVRLQPGQPVAQLSFDWLDGPADRPYGHPELGSRYQGQTGAVAAR